MAAASAAPLSVSENTRRPSASSPLIRPWSSSSWSVGYTEPGLGRHAPPLLLLEPLHDLVAVHRLVGEREQDGGANVAAAGARPGAAAGTVTAAEAGPVAAELEPRGAAALAVRRPRSPDDRRGVLSACVRTWCLLVSL